MHEAATHSDVSAALVSFALAPLAKEARSAVAAAHRAIAEARAILSSTPADTAVAGLPAQAGSSSDLRLRAWSLGAQLTAQAVPSLATPVVAAALTAGERFGASDEAIAEAVAIGTEAATHTLAALDSSEYRARWNLVSSIGVLGATLAVARLLGLDAPRAQHALGVAATQAAGLARNAGKAMEAIEIGKAAADAIESALVAKHGFTSAVASIDGRRGLAALMAYRFDAARIAGEPAVWWSTVA
ncbi:MmgE/PrpD family protein [Burkholderia gladioli]|uniref:MmgE/PrpD family protein n=1 Tax=Burkholderia gladioli TaxID=28095 RepID=UPI00164080EF|nr:MmgE/PrpD family protein [Burkholderia gladioli]